MQTTITNTMAFGFPGEHANGQPFRADVYVASSEVTFGKPAFSDTTGAFKTAKATAGTYIGMFVGAHQHVQMALPSDTRTIKVPAGTEVAVASRGCWFTKVGFDVVVGDQLKISSNDWAKAGQGDTPVATIIEVDETKRNVIVRLGE